MENSVRWKIDGKQCKVEKQKEKNHVHVEPGGHFASTVWSHLKRVEHWRLFLHFLHLVAPLPDLHIPATHERNFFFFFFNFIAPVGKFSWQQQEHDIVMLKMLPVVIRCSSPPPAPLLRHFQQYPVTTYSPKTGEKYRKTAAFALFIKTKQKQKFLK